MRRERGSFLNRGTYHKEKGHLLKRKSGTCEKNKVRLVIKRGRGTFYEEIGELVKAKGEPLRF